MGNQRVYPSPGEESLAPGSLGRQGGEGSASTAPLGMSLPDAPLFTNFLLTFSSSLGQLYLAGFIICFYFTLLPRTLQVPGQGKKQTDAITRGSNPAGGKRGSLRRSWRGVMSWQSFKYLKIRNWFITVIITPHCWCNSKHGNEGKLNKAQRVWYMGKKIKDQ